MNLAVVEDVQEAHDNVENHLAHSQAFLRKEIELIERLSKRIKFPYIYKELVRNLAAFEGDLMLILDLGLDLPIAIKRELRNQYSIPEAIIDEQVDGTVVALEAINNLQISPLLIVIATRYGHQDSIENFLSTYIDSNRRSSEVELEFSPNGFSLADHSRAGEIIDFTIRKFEHHFGSRFDSFFDSIKSLSHDACQSTDAITLLSKLLDIDFDEFDGVWRGKEQILREALKSMGSQTGKPLCAVGAWVYALAAYRCEYPTGNWLHKFNVSDLQSEFLQYRVIPEQAFETLRHSIQTFYEMCIRLFRSDNIHSSSETLKSVTLSNEVGLNFTLNFPCYDTPGSLYERIQDLANASRQGKAFPQQKHKTSLAIWKFWIASSMASQKVLDTEGMFSPIWRMNIVSEGKETRVIFYE